MVAVVADPVEGGVLGNCVNYAISDAHTPAVAVDVVADKVDIYY